MGKCIFVLQQIHSFYHVKKKKIPLLKSNSYQQSYYSDDGNKSQKGSSYPLQHFEIDCRNKLQDAIKAHRLDFYLVFIVTGGEGVQLFGTQEYYLEKNMLCFVGPDMITSWRSQTDNHQGYTCSFSDDFFNLGREAKEYGLVGTIVEKISEVK